MVWRAGFHAEGANAPTTPAGEHILNANGIEVIPAILPIPAARCHTSNGCKQRRTQEMWDLERFDTLSQQAHGQGRRLSRVARKKYNCNLRTTAALERLKYEVRGIFP